MRLHPLALKIYLPSLLLTVAWGVLELAMPVFAIRELRLPEVQIGLILAGQAIGMLLMDLPGGAVLSRLQSKRTMLFGLVVMSLGGFALSWGQSLAEIVICRVAMGAGLSLYGLSRHAYMAEALPNAERGRAIAWLGGINRGGRAAGPLLGGLISAEFGWRPAFILVGVLLLFAFVATLIYMPNVKVKLRKPPSVQAYAAQLGRTTRENWRVLSSAGVAQLLAQMVRRARGVIIPLYATSILGLDEVTTGTIMSGMSTVDFALFYPAGSLMDRFGRKFAIVPSFMLQGLLLMLIPLTTGFLSLLAVACGLGMANGISSGTMMTLGADLASPKQRSEFLSLWRLVGSSGFAFSPLLIGMISGALALAPATVALGSTGVLASLIFARFVPETLHKQSPP